MKYLHFSNDIFPIVTGGTELFIEELINNQRKLENNYEILWASHSSSHDSKDHFPNAELSKHKRLLKPIIHGNRLYRFSSQAKDISGFIGLLEEFKPDVVHLHSFSSRCGLNHAHAVKKFGAGLVITMHSPICSCMGNLLYANNRICDGILNDQKCTYFRLKSRAIPNCISLAVSLQRGWPLNPLNTTRFHRLLTSRQLTHELHSSWRELTKIADSIHVLAHWSRDMLLRQGVSSRKIHLIKTAGPKSLSPKKRTPMDDGTLRLVYWGRCNPQKGIHLVIDAICALPKKIPIKLDLYGPYWEDSYGKELMSKILDDNRFNVCGSISKKELLPKLQFYDLAVIPSIWMETGPLTVLEAFAAGLPVAGSNLGGIQELLKGVKGCFLVSLNTKSWFNLFLEIINNPNLIHVSKLPVSRDFSDIAKDIDELIINPIKS